MRKGVVQLYIKNNEVIFSLAWNIIFSDNWKVLVLKFLEMKNMVFLSQKVDGNMIFTDYQKILVLIFSEMRNTAFSWAKNLNERWDLLITEKVLFWTFRWWEIWFFSDEILIERWYLHGLFELCMIFQNLGNMVFRAVLECMVSLTTEWLTSTSHSIIEVDYWLYQQGRSYDYINNEYHALFLLCVASGWTETVFVRLFKRIPTFVSATEAALKRLLPVSSLRRFKIISEKYGHFQRIVVLL